MEEQKKYVADERLRPEKIKIPLGKHKSIYKDPDCDLAEMCLLIKPGILAAGGARRPC